jgi:hypothetical protein
MVMGSPWTPLMARRSPALPIAAADAASDRRANTVPPRKTVLEIAGMVMSKPLKLRSADLRRLAAAAREPERERKMLALADQLDEAERGIERQGENTARAGAPQRSKHPWPG